MSTKKGNNRNTKKTRATSGSRSGAQRMRLHSSGPVLPLKVNEDSTRYLQVRLNPETAEEREKRLATRKARTLRIFQKAYENQRQQRKAS